MSRRVILLFVLCLTSIIGPMGLHQTHAIPPYYPGLASPFLIVQLIDALTRRDKPTLVSSTIGPTMTEGKLLVARTKMQVNLERSSKNWRGQVVVHLIVPTEITYTVDLRAIRVEHVQIDAGRNQVTIIMPAPCIEDVIPILSAIKVEDQFRTARSKCFDRKTVAVMQNEMLKEDFERRARCMAEHAAGDVRDQARLAVAELLGKLFAASGISLKVVVQ